MDNRQRRAKRRQVRKHRSRKRLLILLLLVVIAVGACSLRELLKSSPSAVTEPAASEPVQTTTEDSESETEEEETEPEQTEAAQPDELSDTENGDTEEGTEQTAQLPGEDAFSQRLQGFSEVLETTQILAEPGSSDELKQVVAGDYVEAYGSAGGYTKVSFGEVMGYLPDGVLEDASSGELFKVVDGVLIVNKTYYVPESYDPGLKTEVMIQFERMKDAIESEGLYIDIGSGYRSYEYQEGVIERNIEAYGEEETARSVAPAGHSEHQTGLAIDIINDQPEHNIVESFKNTPEGQWLADNSYRFGFILRYPEGKEDVTGYMYEPWHFRYVGEETAARVFDSGLTLEEYFELD